jgi:hypothetical protein
MLVEKRDGSVTVPKQSMVSSRNMEFCRRWGVSQAVRTAVWPESYPRDFVYLATLRGQDSCAFGCLRSRSAIRATTRRRRPARARRSISIRSCSRAEDVCERQAAYNTSLESFTQDEAGVTVTLTDIRRASSAPCARVIS